VSLDEKVRGSFDLVYELQLTFVDNHMINGTKLLNVAGMTRGRRDGILKSEKTRNVVKIGPMHLKGVW
jgi:protein SOK2